jgi:DNA-directed RNA polymerase beta' subunit
MMSHLVTENSQDSISFNPLVCSPYNADFDGDEMNLFFIHDTLSLSEALNLMLPQLNLKLKGSFKYIIALIQVMCNFL